jgi:hypothetical protein
MAPRLQEELTSQTTLDALPRPAGWIKESHQ